MLSTRVLHVSQVEITGRNHRLSTLCLPAMSLGQKVPISTSGLPVTRSERALYLLKTHPDTVRERGRLKPRVRKASATMANTIKFAQASVHRSPCAPNL